MSDYQLPECHDPAVIADLQEMANRVKQHPDPKSPVIFYGSSSFRLWDPAIRTDLDTESIVNLAFGGSTVVSCDYYFEQIMEPYPEAKSMVIYAGDNDLGNGKSPTEVRDGFLKILDKVEKRFGQIPVFFLSIKPSPSKQPIFEKIVESNRLLKIEAANRANLNYVDIFTPMLTSAGQSDPGYFLEDMLHMNETGYQVWQKVMLGWRAEVGF